MKQGGREMKKTSKRFFYIARYDMRLMMKLFLDAFYEGRGDFFFFFFEKGDILSLIPTLYFSKKKNFVFFVCLGDVTDFFSSAAPIYIPYLCMKKKKKKSEPQNPSHWGFYFCDVCMYIRFFVHNFIEMFFFVYNCLERNINTCYIHKTNEGRGFFFLFFCFFLDSLVI